VRRRIGTSPSDGGGLKKNAGGIDGGGRVLESVAVRIEESYTLCDIRLGNIFDGDIQAGSELQTAKPARELPEAGLANVR
jgi:hypothetical protein